LAHDLVPALVDALDVEVLAHLPQLHGVPQLSGGLNCACEVVIHIAHLVTKLLKLGGSHVGVVKQNLVVDGRRHALSANLRANVEFVLVVGDSVVDHSSLFRVLKVPLSLFRVLSSPLFIRSNFDLAPCVDHGEVERSFAFHL